MSPRMLTAALLIALARTAAAAPADLATEFAAEAAVPGFLVPEGLTTRGSIADVLPLADGRVLLVTDSGRRSGCAGSWQSPARGGRSAQGSRRSRWLSSVSTNSPPACASDTLPLPMDANTALRWITRAPLTRLSR